jgi:hypothetical protein
MGQVVELPLTTVQDYSLLHILQDYSIQLWTTQIKLILEKHGLISFIVHPDYLLTKKALSVYRNLLCHLSELRAERNLWIALPGDIQQWWRERQGMKVVLEADGWRIVGPGSERARLAFASVREGKIEYTLEGAQEHREVDFLAK